MPDQDARKAVMLWFLLAEAIFSLDDFDRRRRFSQDYETLEMTTDRFLKKFGSEALEEILAFYESLFRDATTKMAVDWRSHRRSQKESLRSARASYPHIMAGFSTTGPHLNDYRPVTVRPGRQFPRCILIAYDAQRTESTILTRAMSRALGGS
jgi:hypothetical protein